jgi:hypothetical protein
MFDIDCTREEKAMFRLRMAAAKTRESVSGIAPHTQLQHLTRSYILTPRQVSPR